MGYESGMALPPCARPSRQVASRRSPKRMAATLLDRVYLRRFRLVPLCPPYG